MSEAPDPDSFIKNEPEVEQQEAEAPEYSAAEQAAMEKGWTPDREAWEADPKNAGKRYRDAETFLEFGELLNEVSKVKRDLRKTQDGFMEERKRAYEKGKQEAQARFKDAVEAGDPEAAEAARQDMQAIDQANAQAVQSRPEEVEDFLSRNPQLEADAKLYKIADALATGFVEEGYSLKKALEETEKEVRERFPEKFGITRRPSAPSVESGKRPAKASRLPKFSELPENEQMAIKNLERLGMPRDKIMKQMLENGEI